MTQQEQWGSAFELTARQYWTPERLKNLLGNKKLLVTPDHAPRLLRAIGLLHRDGSMPPKERRKFFQLNHMLRALRPSIEEMLGSSQEFQILDAGCGRAYLTMALAWCFEHVFDGRARILGVDRNHDLIVESRRRTEIAGLTNTLRFEASDLANVDPIHTWSKAFPESEWDLDILIALHACDTATDDAIALGVQNRAKLIAVAPCCQAELARGWAELEPDGAFAPVWGSPHLRRTTAASMTDSFRTLLLAAAGYQTRVSEFVESTHTPKNTLIRGMLQGRPQPNRMDQYEALKRATGGVGIKLEALLARLTTPQ